MPCSLFPVQNMLIYGNGYFCWGSNSSIFRFAFASLFNRDRHSKTSSRPLFERLVSFSQESKQKAQIVSICEYGEKRRSIPINSHDNNLTLFLHYFPLTIQIAYVMSKTFAKGCNKIATISKIVSSSVNLGFFPKQNNF